MRAAVVAASFVPALPLARAACAAPRRAPARRRVYRACSSSSSPSSPPSSPTPVVAPPSPSPSSAPAPDSAIFRCPRCGSALPPAAAQQLSSLPAACGVCNNAFPRNSSYVDLTVAPRAAAAVAALPRPLAALAQLAAAPRRQSLFQLPLISYAYERGWRDSFALSGFPGIERELDLLLDFAPRGQLVLDMSCGTGLMARRLAVSRAYERVIAADFSAAMLREAAVRARADAAAPEFDLLRADVAALPLRDAVVDTVHVGAALHCWPCVPDGLREVHRVLKPGGKLFATTFANGMDHIAAVRDLSPLERVRALVHARRVEAMRTAMYTFFERKQLLYLAQAAGFEDVDVTLDKFFLVLRCRKPLK